MATEVTIGGGGTLFVGEDKTIRLEVLDANGLPVDMAGWAIIFDVRATDTAADPPLLSKVAVPTGLYAPTRAANLQRAVVTLTDDDLNLFKGSNIPVGAKTYRHSWKRTTADSETVLARGPFAPEKATAP